MQKHKYIVTNIIHIIHSDLNENNNFFMFYFEPAVSTLCKCSRTDFWNRDIRILMYTAIGMNNCLFINRIYS